MTAVDFRMREMVAAAGHAVVCVPAETSGFLAYTVGLSGDGLHELYVTGDAPHALHYVMNALAAEARAAKTPWQRGTVVDIGRGGRFVARAIRGERMPMVRRFYGAERPALRMVRVG